jgi:transcriptional antiterminator
MPSAASVKGQHLLIASMLSNPALTSQNIADTLNISKSTVDKVRQTINKTLAKKDSTAIAVEQYRMLLQKQAPLTKRVEVLSKAMDMVDTNPFVAIRAVEYSDGIDGIAPKQQQIEQLERETRPMFVLPGDAKVQVNITNNYQASNEKKSDV